jgi:hypothetical protein
VACCIIALYLLNEVKSLIVRPLRTVASQLGFARPIVSHPPELGTWSQQQKL